MHYNDDTPAAPKVTAKAGWTFTGWSPAVADKVTGTVVYNAKYTQNAYTVTFNIGANGTTSDTTVFTGLHYNDDTPDAPSVTANDGWTFTGWSPAVADKVTGTVVYNAQYTQNEYTVTFNIGANGTTSDTTVFTGLHYNDDTPLAPSVTANVGWTFTGWSPAVADKVTGTVVYNAQYTQNEYTVTFNIGANGTTSDTTVFTGLHYNDDTPLAPSVTANVGWTFTGWSPAVADKVTGTVVYNAQYTQNEYTVTFNIGANGTTSDTTVFTGLHYNDDTPLAPSVTANVGWTFTGWSPAVADKVTSTVVYNAQYTQNVYTVTFNVGANGTTSDTVTYTGLHFGDAFPAAPNVTAKAGWTFTGWPTMPATVIGNATFNAAYTRNSYIVTFVDFNGNILGTDTVFYGEDATPPAPPSREGYTFTGWSAGYNNITSAVTLTAQYAIKTYTVVFYAVDGVTPLGSAQTVNWGSAAAPVTAPALAGQTFSRWALTGDDEAAETSLSNVRENIRAVAQYTPNTYTVTFVDYDGTPLGTVNVLYGGSVSAPATPQRQGYTFTGWNAPLSGVTQDMTVTARYRINTYTVTFADYDGTVLAESTVNWNTGATAPAVPERDGFTFTGWDIPFDAVTSDITVTAQYEAMTVLADEEVPAATDEQFEAEEIPVTVEDEPIPEVNVDSNSWMWWLLLIPVIGLLLWLLLAWLTVVPVAEAITANADGTFTIQWGYKNRKLRKYTVEEEDSLLTAVKGAIVTTGQPPVTFEKGEHNDVFKTVVLAGSTVQWQIKRRKEKVELKEK